MPIHQSTRENQGAQTLQRWARGEMSTKVILLVEDNPDDELLTLRALKKTGVQNEVVVAHDGVEALERLRSDERTRRLPVVILTSSREQQDMLDGYGLGANSYIRKPVDFEQFVRTVEQLRLYWLVLNEAPPGIV